MQLPNPHCDTLRAGSNVSRCVYMTQRVLELRHIDVFCERGAILFHDLLPSSKVQECRNILNTCTSLRNTWQSSQVLKKLCLNHEFAFIAAQLCRLKSLRFGCDHYYPSFDALTTFFARGALNNLISIDGLEVGLLLNLSNVIITPVESSSSIPLLSGSGNFFATHTPLDLSIEHAEGPFLLMTYCQPGSRYLHKFSDPFTHDVKKEDRAFGDRLSNTHHPLVHY